MKTKKTKRKKYSLGTGKNGVVRNYIESPNEALVQNDIAIAKAHEAAANNNFANGLSILGNMAIQQGMGMAGGTNGVIKGVGEGFGNIFSGQKAAGGGTIVGPGKDKTVRDLTEEEAVAESAKTQFTPEGMMALFGMEESLPTRQNIPINLGKYKDVGYFNPIQDPSGKYTLKNTQKNPANYDLYKQQLKNIMKLNPDVEIDMKGFTPLINQKAFGGKAGVNVEVEGGEVAETPDGELIDFNGPSHEKGGIGANLPENTDIYSKRIKVKGKTMAERKLAREKKLMTLEKLLEKSKDDTVLKKTIARTKNNNKIEEEKDKDLQNQVRQATETAQNQNEQMFMWGGSAISNFFRGLFGGNKNSPTTDPITGFDPEYAKKQLEGGTFKSDNASLSAGTLDSGEISGVTDYSGNDRVTFNPGTGNASKVSNNDFLPNLTGGDLIGLAGTAFSTFEPMKNTQANRAGDTPNINAFEDFGNDALDRVEEAKGYIGSQRDKALTDLENNRNRAVLNNRKSARGVNTQRALDLSTDVNTNNAQNDIYANFSKQMMGLLSQQAGFENQQDSAVMQGEQNRDLADRQDRDNYFSQMAQDIATKGQGIQQMGKMLNQNKKNTISEKAVNSLSKYGFQWDESGNLVDKAGNPVTEEKKQALKTLGINID